MRNLGVVALVLPLALGSACAQKSQTGAMGTGERASAPSQEPLLQPGPAVKGHAEDRVVAGRIASAQSDSISISTDGGETQTLRIVPETSVQVDGQDSSSTQLQEGMPVQASFDRVSGENVAVEVWAGAAPSSADQPPAMSPGVSQPPASTERSTEPEPSQVESEKLRPSASPR